MTAVSEILRAVAQLLRAQARDSLQPLRLPLDPVKLQARQGEAARLRAVATLLEEEVLTLEAVPVVTAVATLVGQEIPATASQMATPEKTLTAKAILVEDLEDRATLTEGTEP